MNIKLKVTLILLTIVAVPFIATILHNYNRARHDKERYKNLSLEYLNPNYSKAYREYWQIHDYAGHKTALRQEFDIARFEAMEESYGEDEAELRHFFRLRMINWLDRKMIEEAELLLRFDRRGDEKEGVISLQLIPMPEERFKERVPY